MTVKVNHASCLGFRYDAVNKYGDDGRGSYGLFSGVRCMTEKAIILEIC